MANVTIEPAKSIEKGTLRGTVLLIRRDGKFVGMIHKLPNTRTEIHPYRVLERAGDLMPHKMVGAFYTDADSVTIGPSFDYQKCQIGGRTAAMLFAKKHFAIYGVPAKFL